MARCIIFGGNGFIGSHLVDALVEAGHQVTCFDRSSNRSPTYVSDNVEQIFGDFMNEGDIVRALKDQELIFHFISTTTPLTAEENPLLDIQTNVTASIQLFQKCVEAGVSKVYFASSGGAIYGDQEKQAFSELDPTYPASPYAIGKLTIENYLRFFKQKHGLDYTVFRISNPYGTRQNPTRRQGVIPIFLRSILQDGSINIVGDGSMVRDYVYVEDAVDMIVRTIGKECKYDVYNLGSGKGVSINELIEVIGATTGRVVAKEYIEQPKTFVSHAVLNTSRYIEEFGFKPSVQLEQGIELTWDEMRSIYENN